MIAPPIAILVYHRITTSPLDLNLLNVSPSHFEEHLSELASQRKVIPLDTLVKNVKEGNSEPGSVAITFDDGYEDFVLNALPILKRHNLPATLFITTNAATKNKYSFWWDRIEDILLSANPEEVYELIGPVTSGLEILDEAIKFQRSCLSVPTVSIDNYLRLKFGSSQSIRHPIVSIQELADSLSDVLNITIGSHSMTHSQMSTLSAEFQKIELRESKKIISKIFGSRASNLFSLPYGHPGSWNNDTVNNAHAEGYDGLMTTQQSVLTNGDLKSFAIPRLLVRDWTRSEFKDWLKNGHPFEFLDLSLNRRTSQFEKYYSAKKLN